jgi:hypothetical protein
MRYMASIYVSDVMDQIACTLEIQGWAEQYGPPDTVYQKTLIWAGVGDDDPVSWVKRALFLTYRDMSEPAERVDSTGTPSGGPHIISETGDTT